MPPEIIDPLLLDDPLVVPEAVIGQVAPIGVTLFLAAM
jgi:hypothetical protein